MTVKISFMRWTKPGKCAMIMARGERQPSPPSGLLEELFNEPDQLLDDGQYQRRAAELELFLRAALFFLFPSYAVHLLLYTGSANGQIREN